MNVRKIFDFNKKTTIFCVVTIVFLGIIIVQQARILHLKKDTRAIITREQGKHEFTNPILDFEFSATSSDSLISSGDVRRFVNNLQEEKEIEHISVYFRDLNNGPWIGINEKEYFAPASMLKTPLLISLYKWSENDQSVLSKKVVAEERFFLNIPTQISSEPSDIVVGESYTFFELGKKMIQNSDNVAAAILHYHIPKQFVDNTFSHIGVVPTNQGLGMLLRIKDISSFYRVLFNASYLNRENSEMVLKIMTETTYKDGLEAGLPKTVKVAHKFGERINLSFIDKYKDVKQNVIQIHDCGIVYYPKTPYILCVMTRGNDLKKQQTVIKQISHFFYEKLNKRQEVE